MSPLPSEEREAALDAGVELFDAGRYLAAHELFEELWESTEGGDADFFKGLLQAAVALHHLEAGNVEGAERLHVSHRALLARYQPEHLGLGVTRFLEAMQRHLSLPLRKGSGTGPRPQLGPRR